MRESAALNKHQTFPHRVLKMRLAISRDDDTVDFLS